MLARLARRAPRVRFAAPRAALRPVTGALALLLAMPALAVPGDGPAHPSIEPHDELVRRFLDGDLSLNDVRRRGLSVFSTPFNFEDGFGDGPHDPGETDPRQLGQRPTLQGNGAFLRVNGLDAQSCNECHTIVSNATRPPELGIGGVGGAVQNAIIQPSVLDVADSTDVRVAWQPGFEPDLLMASDGIADTDGRFANPPFLFGGGGVELLGKEMTADLQALLVTARDAAPGTVTPLVTHGVDFGELVTLPGGEVDVSGVEGIGPSDPESVSPEEVLVVRPFGRKGENFSMRDFDRGALPFHFGIEPVEVVGEGVDGDGDGVVDEATIGELTALHVFDVTNPPPFQDPLDAEARAGLARFQDLGCAGCHVPAIETRSRSIPLAFPEDPTDPSADVYAEIDLVRLGYRPAPGGGVVVPLHSDLKRHDMGPGLAETFAFDHIPRTHFITARLWGIADTAPYLHDGRAMTLHEAIAWHGGEAEAARDAYLALEEAAQEQLIAYLKTLRTPLRPNEELVQGRSRQRSLP